MTIPPLQKARPATLLAALLCTALAVTACSSGVTDGDQEASGSGSMLVAETTSYIDEQSSQFPQFRDQTVSILINRGEEAGVEFINVPGSFTTDLLTELGFAPHPHAEQLSANRGAVSLENLPLVDADGLMIANHGGYGSPESAAAWLDSSELFQNLTAVRDGHVAYENPSPRSGNLDLAWAFSHPNVLAVPWTVDQLTSAFAGIFD